MSKFSDFYHIDGGFAFKSEEFKRNGDIPVIRIGDISEGRVQFEDEVFYTPSPQLKKFLVLDGDVLIALSGATAGKTGIFKSDSGYSSAYLNQRVGRVRAKDGNKATQVLAGSILQLPRFQHYIKMEGMGGAQPNVSPQEIGDFRFQMPDLNECKKIVEILSDCDAAIETAIRKVDAEAQQVKARLKHLLADKQVTFVPLESLVSVQKGVKLQCNNESNGVPYLGSQALAGDVAEFTIDTTGVEALPTDVLLLWDGENAGRVETNLEGMVSSTVMRLRPKKPEQHEFVAGLLKLKSGQIRQMREGSGVPHLPKDFLRRFKVPNFSEQKQKLIGQAFAEARELSKYSAETNFLLKKQKRGLMQQLLTGKLRVREAV